MNTHTVKSISHLLSSPGINSQFAQIRCIIKDSRLQQSQSIGLQEERSEIGQTVKNASCQDLNAISIENKTFQGDGIAE